MFGEYAEKLWDAGLSIIPCKGKVPIVKNWAQFSHHQVEPAELGMWEQQYAKCNIGLVCGPASGIVVLDIDDSSLFDLLPKSPVVWRGREGRESRAFKWSGENTEHYQGVDIIGVGGQSILPPSIHPDTKQPYVWLNNALPYEDLPELPKMRDPKILKPVLKKANPSPGAVEEGGRHIELRNLSCAMACNHSSRQEIENALATHACSDWFRDPTEPHKGNERKAIKDMVDRALRFAGRDLEEEEVTVTRVEIPEVQTPKVDLTDLIENLKVVPPQSEKAYERPPIPKRGALRWVYEYIEQQSSPQIPSLALGGALAIVSTLIQNRFKCGRIGAHSFVLNVAPSGTGKSYPYLAAEKILPIQMLGSGGYKSGKILTNSLASQRERLDVLDEVSAMFSHMRDGSSFQTEMVDILCGLWSCGPDSFFRFSQSVSGLKEGERQGVWSPAISILASTTDSGLLNSISKVMSEKGFFPRFMIFTQPMLDWKETIDRHDYLSDILKWRDMILEKHPILVHKEDGPNNPYGSYTEPQDAQRLARNIEPFDSSYLEELSKKYFMFRKAQRGLADEAFDSFYARKIEQVVKIALCYELGNITEPVTTETRVFETHTEVHASNIVISKEAFDYAEELWDWMFISQKSFISNLAEGSEKIRNMRTILDYIKSDPMGVTRASFTARFSRLKKTERDEILSDLIASDQIKVVQESGLTSARTKYKYCGV